MAKELESLSLQTFKDRLYHLLETVKAERGESRNAFGLRSGVKENNLRKYLQGTTPYIDKVTAIANAAGFSVGWLLTGEEPMRTKLEDTNIASNTAYAMGTDMIKIPLVDIYQACKDTETTLEKEFFVFPKGAITTRLNVNPTDFQAFIIQDNSMAPKPKLGDLAILDTSYNRPGEGIYVIRIEGTVVIKHMQIVLNKGIRLDIFNNDFVKHEPLIIYLGSSDTDFTIVGRIVYAGTTF